MTGKPGNGTEVPDKPGDFIEATFTEQIVELVNEERSKAGLDQVTLDTEIEKAANIRAKEIQQSFSHTRPKHG